MDLRALVQKHDETDWQSRFEYNVALNHCLYNHPAGTKSQILSHYRVTLSFDPAHYYFCLTGLPKTVYFGKFGVEAGPYMAHFYALRREFFDVLDKAGCNGDIFMVYHENLKQLAILFTPKSDAHARAIAESVCARGQAYYKKTILADDARYANFTSLVGPLSGLDAMSDAFEAVCRLNALSLFKMEPLVATDALVETLKNEADYGQIQEIGRALRNAALRGEAERARALLSELFLKQIKGSFSISLCQDALQYLKYWLQTAFTVYSPDVSPNPPSLCELSCYLTLEEIYEAVLPVIERVAAAVLRRGAYGSAVLQALYFIRRHFAEDIALSDVASYANVSQSYLSRAFGAETGMSVRDAITKARIERARAQLTDTDHYIYRIAEDVGIRDVKYFTRLFKAQTGLSPAEYRRARISG